LNNETATINVGKEVPIVTTETQNEAADDVSTVDKTVQYKDTGVILEVTPQINYNGIILLDIKQNVSDALENTSSGIDSPEISQRELNTKLAVKDGQTILMGGLIDQGDSEIASGIPFLMDLPGIGYLFKYKKEVQEKTELLVMITPYVIETEEVLDQYIGEFKKKMKVLRGRFMSDDNFHRAGE
ncbi:MAG: type II secretion system protein GspD, partial [Thermodesulfobacteriota bacterium]